MLVDIIMSQLSADLLKGRIDRVFSCGADFTLRGKWQQKFLSSHLKETQKLYIEVCYRILTLSLFMIPH